MSEISSRNAAAKPRQGSSVWAGLTPVTGALLGLLLVAGFGGTYSISRDIRMAAAEVWDNRADAEADRLTATLLQWIETAVTPVHAMATLYQGSTNVSDDEFWDAVTLLEDNQQDFFPSALVTVLPGEIIGGETWQVVHSIAEEGRLSVGSDLAEDPALAQAVAAALESPGQAVIGSQFRDEIGTAWLVPAIAVEREEDRYVVLALVDLSQMVDGLFKTQVPEGIELRLLASAAESSEAAALLFGPGEAGKGTLVTNAIRGVVDGARFKFLWDVTEAFAGGKVSRRADMVLVGGILATVLLALFIAFLLRQNQQIARVVRQRTAELRLALDNMPGGMFMLDRDLRFVVFNAQIAETWGLPHDFIKPGLPIETLVRTIANLGGYPEKEVERAVATRMAQIRDPDPEGWETTLPTGQHVVIRYSITEDGGRVAVVSDITERKRAEEALRQGEARLNLALRATGAGVWDYDLKNGGAWWSPELYNLLGFEPEDLAPSYEGWKSLLHPDDLERITDGDEVETWKAGRASRSEYRIRRKDGSFIWIEDMANATLGDSGGILRLTGVMRDITERKQAQELIETQRALFSDILENVPQGMALFDTDKKLLAWNSQYPKTLNVDPAMLTPETTIRDLTVHLAKRGYYGGGDVEAQAEARIKKLYSGNTRAELSFDGKRIYDAQGTLTPDGRLAVIYTDITERLEAEKRLKDAYATISDSIRYASRIQRSVLNGEETLAAATREHMVLWEPRDVVGGDMYWCQTWGDGQLVILADCTGHGVPGAFMTLIATGALDRAVNEVSPGKVGQLIQRMHQIVQTTLSQQGEGGESDDGLELGACYLSPDKTKLTFAGARVPLFVVNGDGVTEIQGTRAGIGYRGISPRQRYEETEVALKPGTTFCMSSDGYLDQVGGKRRLMFGKKRFKEVLQSLEGKSFAEQKETLRRTLIDYQGEERRRDDVSVVAFRV